MLTECLVAYLILKKVINIRINIGVVPITGFTLTFISYGDTYLLINVITVGLILKFINERSVLNRGI